MMLRNESGEVIGHLNIPATSKSCQVNHCPTCDRPRRMLVSFAEWYGATLHCSGCGDDWSDGYRGERPFARGWRRKAIEWTRQELLKIGVKS